ncbi:uncharacterized protein FOMMEDRAFT_144395, partial [Fomitiporia mediterranea MF3/22]|uniref:uncharacterized protein n=1 Tax=Fomitiporia mediterranea (strain MF3/22) TaxID=694068 RepID=UPI0004408CA9
MSANAEPLTADLNGLSISENEQSADSNPWSIQVQGPVRPPLKTPDPVLIEQSLGEQSTGAEPEPEPDTRPRTSAEVLSEFDPLADTKEADARQAWASSTGHPMPPKPLSLPSPVDVPSSTTVPRDTAVANASPPGIGSGLASLANLAKSFTLPKVRTRSVDIAPPPNIVTPNTISTFAAQQRSRPDTPQSAPPASQQNTSTDNGSNADPVTDSTSHTPNPRREPPPFDFQLFLDQMKSKSAEPVAKYLRSFLSNFAKKPLAINEQIKVINEFLNFISIRMRDADIWRNATEDEFDNAMEAMEKLVMNRLYEFTFVPQLAEAQPPRPITTDDLERDGILAQRIALFSWIEEKHLEVPDSADGGGFLMFAQQELLKINHYKAPRDKLICVLNCCKVIFGLIRHLHKEENADSFVPILIFVVLKANPPNLISNIEYIQRFRNPQKLQSEAGYYLSSLMGAVQFIETLDHTSLSHITAEEFERNVEFAIHDLPGSPEPNEKPSPFASQPSSRPTTPSRSSSLSALSSTSGPSTPQRPRLGPDLGPSTGASPHAGEESAQPLSLSLGGLGTAGGNFADDTRRFLQKTGDAIGKPFNALGRFLGEALDGLDTLPPGVSSGRRGSLPGGTAMAGPSELNVGGDTLSPSTPPIQTPYKPRIRPSTPNTQTGPQNTPARSSNSGWSTPDSRFGAIPTPSRIGPGTYPTRPGGGEFISPLPSRLSSDFSPGAGTTGPEGQGLSRTPTPALDLAGVQAEIDLAHARAADASLGTLLQIFPAVDREVAQWVLEAEGGDLGRSIEKLLEIGGG